MLLPSIPTTRPLLLSASPTPPFRLAIVSSVGSCFRSSSRLGFTFTVLCAQGIPFVVASLGVGRFLGVPNSKVLSQAGFTALAGLAGLERVASLVDGLKLFSWASLPVLTGLTCLR